LHIVEDYFFLFTRELIRSLLILLTRVIVKTLGVLRHKVDQGGEDFFTLGCSEIDFGVWMEAVGDWGFLFESLDYMLEILIIRSRSWALERVLLAVSEWIQVKLILDEGVIEELDLVGIAKTSVPIVDNMTAVHNLAENVPEIIPRHVTTLELIDVLVKHNTRVSEITQGEIVPEIPALLTESLSLDNARVEVAECEEDALQLDIFVIKLSLIWEVTPGSLHVGSETTWRLIR